VHHHNAVLRGDVDALDALAHLLLQILIPMFMTRHRRIWADAVFDSIVDAILEYRKAPDRFNDQRGLYLDQYIGVLALRNLRDLMRADSRRRARETGFANAQATSWTPSYHDTGRATDSRLRDSLEQLCEPHELLAARLWLVGERRTEPLAKAMNLSNLSLPEQRREVKRLKDRLTKRWTRQMREMTTNHSC
jgi:RNA polymerase sigma-70 factor, ECF subfamily